MSVVWMVLPYSNVHRHTAGRRLEITGHLYRRLFARRRPLLHDQGHVVIYRGLRARGPI